jgi:hypothetical protein
MSSARAIDLLHLQAELFLDERGRVRGSDGVLIACAGERQALWIGTDVPDAIADALIEGFAHALPPGAASDPPPALSVCERVLTTHAGGLQRRGGPSFVIPRDARFPCDAPVICTGAPEVELLRSANPGNWDPMEWDELLAGRLGPWAIAIDDGNAASICHTPGPMTARAAECGVWTDPRYRRRGYAAATTAAWVPLVSHERTLFYSTEADNRSSQRVAARLGLEEIGWTWRLHRPRAASALDVHPLCSLAGPVA